MALSQNVTDEGAKAVDNASSGGGLNFSDLSSTVITKFIQVLEAALIIIVTLFVIRWLKKYFERIEVQHEQQKTALNLLEKIVSGFVIVVGITFALKTVGLDMSLLVSVGLLGLSYGLKDVIKNYIAGILIFLKSPFKIGDIVKIKNFTGRIEKMEFQATSLKTFDHRDVTIYNSDIMAQSIENYSRYPMRRMEINVKLGYGSDTEKAIRLFNKILENEAVILKNPKYSIVFKSFTDTSIVIQLKFWVPIPSNMLAIRSDIALKINKTFDEAEIFSPYTKGIESDKDYSLTEKRQNKIKEFYANPLFAEQAPIQQPQDPNLPPSQLVPEIIDADEPSIEEDL